MIFSTAAPINNTTIQRPILRLSNSKVFTVFIPTVTSKILANYILNLIKINKVLYMDWHTVFGFIAYSFEQYNGILGCYHSNNHSIEVQIMRKFLCETQIQSLEAPSGGVGLFNVFDDGMVSSVHDTDIRGLQSLAEYCNLRSDYSNNSSVTIQVSRYFA